MNITDARFSEARHKTILARIDGVEIVIPVERGNRHYDALLRQGIEPAPFVLPVTDPAVRALWEAMARIAD